LKGDLVVENMKANAQDSKDLVLIAEKLETKVDTVENVNFMLRNIAGYGNEANVIAKVFTQENGVLSNPIKGNNAAFFVIVDDITYPKAGEDKWEEIQSLVRAEIKTP